MSVVDVQNKQVDIALTGGLLTDIPTADVPPGLSPNCQDCDFFPRAVNTRYGIGPGLFPAIAGNPTITYLKTFRQQNLMESLLALDSNGAVWQASSIAGGLSQVGAVAPGSRGKSCTLFGQEWIGLSDGQFGLDMPRRYDGQYFDRISQVGPGAPPAVADLTPAAVNIATISRAANVVSVSTSSAHGVVIGDQVTIAAVTYGGATPFNGTFVVVSIPNSTHFTYNQTGENGSGTNNTGTETPAGQITVGVHQVVVLFVLRSGYITKPSPPASWAAAGGKQVSVTSIATGPPDVVARIIAFTAAGGATWFYLPSFIINDNVTTSATMDFTDPGLEGGSPVALLFNNVELGEVSGFAVYANRLITWGERNKIFNFLNLSFDGGFATSPTAGSAGPSQATAAADGGGGGAVWTVTLQNGPSANANILPSGRANPLNCTGYGFAIPANATVTGLIVTAKVRASSSGQLTDATAQLLKAGAAVGNTEFTTAFWTVADTNQVFGSQTDLWGSSWAPSDINSASFGVAVWGSNSDATRNHFGFIDGVTIAVYYTLPGPSSQPLGWAQGANFAGGNSALAGGLQPYWGDAYSITGDGATATRGQITQDAYQDYLQVPIIERSVMYRVRARIAANSTLAQGTIHVNLQSTIGGFTTTGLAVPAAQLTQQYQEFQAFLTDVPIINPPSDLVIQIYADGTPTNGGIFLIDNVEVYPANEPYLASQARASTVDDPETFDGVNGLLEPPTNEPVRTVFVITDRSQLLANDHLYLVTDNQLWRTQDNGGNPSTWAFSEVSLVVGTPSINGVDVGEDWVVIAHTTGLYLYYFGSEPTKIAQEVQTITAGSPASVAWDQINWAEGFAVWVKVDVQNKRVLVGAPFGAGTTLPNGILMMNYRGLVSSTQIIGTPPMHPSYTGRFIAQAIGRKWSSWTISANACWIEPKDSPLAIPSAGAGAVFLGNSAGNGKIYNLTPANGYLDDGANIPSFYDTAFVPSDEQKEQYGMLGSLVYLSYLRAHIQGSGNVQFTFFGPDYVNSKTVPRAASPGVPNQTPATPAAPPIVLSSPAKNDIETFADFIGERINVRIAPTGAGGSGPWFSAQKLELFLQPNPTGAIRGFN